MHDADQGRDYGEQRNRAQISSKSVSCYPDPGDCWQIRLVGQVLTDLLIFQKK